MTESVVWTLGALKEHFEGLLQRTEARLTEALVDRDAHYGHRLGELEMAVKDIGVLKQSVQSASDAIKAQERHVAIVQVASQTAINKAEEAQIRYNEETARSRELRDAAANEFRATIADTTATMMPRHESVTARVALQERLEEAITTLRNELALRVDAVEKRAEEERRRGDRGEGFSAGKTAMISSVIGLVFLLIAVAGFLATR